jgi:hypothetical protein
MNPREDRRVRTEKRILERLRGLISRNPPWATSDPLLPAEAWHGPGKPPRAGPGERRKSLGPGTVGMRVSHDYRPGFGWQSLLLAVIVVAVAFMVLVPAGVLDRIMHGPPQVSLARPDVLVVSANPSDRATVAQTVQPRGYTVRSVSSVDAGRSILAAEPERIGIVVIDGGMAGAKRLISEVKVTCPAARVIVLSGARDAGEISSRLVGAGVN